MSATLTEFLQEQAKTQKDLTEKNKLVIEDWRRAVEALFRQIREWIGAADSNRLIEIEEREIDLMEPGLGKYRVSRLDFRALGKWIGIIPKARLTVGYARPPQKSIPERAAGRVDITDEIRRYVLYRFRQDDSDDLWMIDDLHSEPKPLDRQAFETALMSYLR